MAGPEAVRVPEHPPQNLAMRSLLESKTSKESNEQSEWRSMLVYSISASAT